MKGTYQVVEGGAYQRGGVYPYQGAGCTLIGGVDVPLSGGMGGVPLLGRDKRVYQGRYSGILSWGGVVFGRKDGGKIRY